jgi:hypothetical protein
MPQQDYRARLQPKNVVTNRSAVSPTILGPRDPSNILYPLYQTGGVLFPYTPSITTGAVADYDPSSFIHSNYGYNAYIRSYPRAISIQAEFTAQTNDEALYLLAVIHFFRAVTKSYFGVNPYNLAGTPPPTLLFNYLGEQQFNNVPVIIKFFDYTYAADIDYVPVNTAGKTNFTDNLGVKQPLVPSSNYDGWSWVPTHMAVSIELDTQYVPIQLRNDFNLDKFRSGALVGKGYI